MADLFPMMPEAELAMLAADIKANGLQYPIIVKGNVLIDGRNRRRACELAEVEPRFETFAGTDVEKFIISSNLRRRQLTESQRALTAARLCNMRAGHRSDLPSANSHEVRSLQAAADLFNVGRHTVSDAKQILQQRPELAKRIDAGKMTVHQAMKKLRSGQALQHLEMSFQATRESELEKVCDLRHCSCRELFASMVSEGIKPAACITDPPFGKKDLQAFSDLAEGCRSAAVPLVAVISGQYCLPEVMARLCAHLTYRWLCCYMEGGVAHFVSQAAMNSNWKPILLFGGTATLNSDVFQSGGNDKRFHEWGKSEAGMMELVERLTKPGDLICDPFSGGGTTAVAALRLGRKVIGCDVVEAHVAVARKRSVLAFENFKTKT